jgi:DNA polymerase-3 subunit alpha
MAIDWPITALKHVGDKASETIIKNAPYSSVKDFYTRVNKRACNSRIVESLIIAGCFKDFGKKKDVLLEYRSLKGKKEQEKSLPIAFESKENMIIAMEDIYGFESISLETLYKKKIKKYGKLHTYDEFSKAKEHSIVKVFGKVVRKNVIESKQGNKMAFLNIRNSGNEIKITLFSDSYFLIGDKIDEDDIVIISGRINIYNREKSLILAVDKFKKKNFESGSWFVKLN